MYRVTKLGNDFRVYNDDDLVIVVSPGNDTIYELFSTLYEKGLTTCDKAFYWWMGCTEQHEVVAMLHQCDIRVLRPDERAVDGTTNQTTSKPPVGITTHSVWLASCAEARVADIAQAMQRYTAARLPIPQDWLDEYNELCTQLKGS